MPEKLNDQSCKWNADNELKSCLLLLVQICSDVKVLVEIGKITGIRRLIENIQGKEYENLVLTK